MSTFGGKIKEIPGISVDRFNGENNWLSKVYFLSHCHSDHMIGLSNDFFNTLIKYNKSIYMSPISKVILSRTYPTFTEIFSELVLEHPTSITVENTNVLVTCIPAGHCPGSVMFLFETNTCRILYTGDYRIKPSDIMKFGCFYDVLDKLKTIDKIYLDTTFFLESYRHFPLRERSLQEICFLIHDWISKDSDNVVELQVSAKVGYEDILKGIYDRFKMPVYVDAVKYNYCAHIPELDQCVSTDKELTKIHLKSTFGSTFGLFIYTTYSPNIRKIKVSAFRWRNHDFNSTGIHQEENGMFYVCYSTHASYEEGRALLKFLKPKDVHICVERPKDPEENHKLYKLVYNTLKKINPETSKTQNNAKLFEIKETDSACESVIQASCSTRSVLDSPPR